MSFSDLEEEFGIEEEKNKDENFEKDEKEKQLKISEKNNDDDDTIDDDAVDNNEDNADSSDSENTQFVQCSNCEKRKTNKHFTIFCLYKRKCKSGLCNECCETEFHKKTKQNLCKGYRTLFYYIDCCGIHYCNMCLDNNIQPLSDRAKDCCYCDKPGCSNCMEEFCNICGEDSYGHDKNCMVLCTKCDNYVCKMHYKKNVKHCNNCEKDRRHEERRKKWMIQHEEKMAKKIKSDIQVLKESTRKQKKQRNNNSSNSETSESDSIESNESEFDEYDDDSVSEGPAYDSELEKQKKLSKKRSSLNNDDDDNGHDENTESSDNDTVHYTENDLQPVSKKQKHDSVN